MNITSEIQHFISHNGELARNFTSEHFYSGLDTSLSHICPIEKKIEDAIPVEYTLKVLKDLTLIYHSMAFLTAAFFLTDNSRRSRYELTPMQEMQRTAKSFFITSIALNSLELLSQECKKREVCADNK